MDFQNITRFVFYALLHNSALLSSLKYYRMCCITVAQLHLLIGINCKMHICGFQNETVVMIISRSYGFALMWCQRGLAITPVSEACNLVTLLAHGTR